MVSVCQSGLCEWSPRGILRDAVARVETVRPGHSLENVRKAQALENVRGAQGDDPEWTEIEQAILRALLNFPEARMAVVREIDRVCQKKEDSS
jgi:hypothetical protein